MRKAEKEEGEAGGAVMPFFFLVCGSIFAFHPGLLDAFVIPKLFVLALGALLLWLSLRRDGARRSSLDFEIAGMWAAMLLSFSWSADRGTSLWGCYLQEFHGLLLMAILTLIFYGARAGGWRTARPFMIASSWGALGLGIVAVAQASGKVPPPFSDQSGRVIGTIGNAAFFGAVVAALTPLALHEAMVPPDWGRWRRWLGRAALLSCVACLGLSRARGAILAAAAGSWVALWLSGAIRARRWHLLAACAILGGFLGLSARFGKGASDSMRIELARISLEAFEQRPLLGWGPDCFALAMRENLTERWRDLAGKGRWRQAAPTDVLQASAHNDIFQVAVTLGAVGLLAYLALWLGLLRCFAELGHVRHAPSMAAAIGCLAALFVQAKLNPLPPPALALGAIAAGMVGGGKLWSSEMIQPRGKLWPWLAFVLAAVAILGAELVQLAAEDQVSIGIAADDRGLGTIAASSFRAANEMMPSSAFYASNRAALIWKIAPLTSRANRRDWLRRALAVAADNVRAHPMDPQARAMLTHAAQVIVADKKR